MAGDVTKLDVVSRDHSEGGVESHAIFSGCMRYRYWLIRVWDSSLPLCCFIMLNPSTATEKVNDPTVKRCMDRARQLGFGGFIVVNLFAIRSTDPAGILSCEDPVGDLNDGYIRTASMVSALVICAWGEKHARTGGRSDSVKEMLRRTGRKLHYLRLCKNGEPSHPLYLPFALQPQEWEEAVPA